MDAANCVEMGHVVKHVVAALYELQQQFRVPTVGSPGARDGQNAEVRRDGTPWGPEPIETYVSIVSALAVATADHLHGTAQVLLDDVDFGPAVMARCTLEAAGRLAWLLDPEVDVRARVGRGFALRVRGQRDNARNIAALMESENAPAAPLVDAAATAAARWPEIVGHAHALGYPTIRGDGGVFLGLDGLAEPSGDVLAFQALRHLEVPMLGQMYSSWSAMAHSSYDALRNHLVVVDPVSRMARIGTTGAQRVLAAGLATVGAVYAFDLAGGYFGADPEPRLRIDDEVLPEIKRQLLAAVGDDAAS